MLDEKAQENIFNPPWETKQVLLAFLISFLIFFVFTAALGLYLKYLNFLGIIGKVPRSIFTHTVWGDLLMLFYFLLLGLAGYFLILKRINGSKVRFFIDFSKIKKDLFYAFKVYLLGFLGAFILGVFIALSIIFVAILSKKDPLKAIEFYSKGLDIERARITAHLGITKIILLVFIAPVFEELFFRGCLYSAIRKRHGFIFSIIATSLLFAFMHGYLFNLLNIIFMGVIVTWIYERRRSLTAPIFFHFLWNLMVFLIMLLSRPG